MSNDTAPCGCEGHADNQNECRYPALLKRVERLQRALDRALDETELDERDGHASGCIADRNTGMCDCWRAEAESALEGA